ncbi:magnesium transporter [Alkalispirochaeta americana]|uniref:Magnesium transporter MgtE n=1 Tax=Alkalispirochaeta americana TaxID=159291 RepID=A0A1N6VZ96_9SPIO|nr:magnesium transporter [Alkalispirochaeta americana]SIQ83197.1 magnesium transporter [Alkalispirochaeta americana]
MLLDLNAIEMVVEELRDALKTEDAAAVARCAGKLSSRRTARELAQAPPGLVITVLTSMDAVKAGRVAGYLPPPGGADLLAAMAPTEAASLLTTVPSDHASNLLQLMPPLAREALVAHLDPAMREELDTISRYAPETAGAAMTTSFLVVPPEASVAQALEAIASAPPEIEKSTYVYVVSEKGALLGVASVRDLVRASRSETVKNVMTRNMIAVRINDSAVDAAKVLRNRRYAMLPVLDEQEKLAGVITLDDAADILAREIADQFSSIGGDRGDESFFTRPLGAVRRRLPWMASNVLLNLIAVAVITGFEDTIAQVAILAAFLPMITDMGGNVGIQSLSVAIRSIALGEAQIRDVSRAVKKELVVGICNGIVLGALFGAIALIMRGQWLLGLVAGTALGINVVVAGIVGGSLPFLIKRLGKDPAMMTGPLLTTITDVTGVTIYLGLSTLFLAQLAG